MLNWDITRLISDWKEDDDIPPDPDTVMRFEEKERLFDEFCDYLASGALDPDRELPF